MICERVREQLPEYFAGLLNDAARETLRTHLDSCLACRNEVEDLGLVWRGLDLMPAAEPEPAVRARFLETLNAYRLGMQHEQGPVKERSAWRGWLTDWWPHRPVWQAAMSVALLLLGVFGGREMTLPRSGSPEVTQLKGEVESLRQLVALSLLQEQSASSRLRGVAFSSQMDRPDSQVENALLYAMNHDANVNVRLSAVDALDRYAGRSEVKQALIDSLSAQDSPLVQIALIDLLAERKDQAAAPKLQELARDRQANESVRQRAEWAIAQIGVSQ
jgi:HEAT repeat protein